MNDPFETDEEKNIRQKKISFVLIALTITIILAYFTLRGITYYRENIGPLPNPEACKENGYERGITTNTETTCYKNCKDRSYNSCLEREVFPVTM